MDPLPACFMRFGVPMSMKAIVMAIFREDTVFRRITTTIWVEEHYNDLIPHVWFKGDLFRPLCGFRGPLGLHEDDGPSYGPIDDA
ncbi:hypothetical protein EUGRSUZ_D01148 [Eucalyptus grandis]|uniref:Uncharacterized protein n=2 Tax=Eucalyptus grandis TaxID=71139 RepID=A0A059CEJ8_EUCGR|nr:hypothetical protein EUGRSUZ_D01148 [Eucalyptus grandis]